ARARGVEVGVRLPVGEEVGRAPRGGPAAGRVRPLPPAGRPRARSSAMRLIVAVPPRFSFRRTVMSHGWAFLPPFRLDARRWVLHRVFALPGARRGGAGRIVLARLTEGPGGIEVETGEAARGRGSALREQVGRGVGRRAG